MTAVARPVVAGLAAPAEAPGGLLAAVERWTGLTAKGLVVTGGAIAGFVAGRLIGSRALLVLVYGAMLMMAAAYVLARRRLPAEATRSALPTRCRVGQSIDVELALTSTRRVATVILEEELPPYLGSPVRIPVPSLAAGEELRHPYTFKPTLRGIYEVGPLVVERSDPFGLTRRRTVIAQPAQLIVHPAVETVHDRVISREWEDPPIRPPMSKPWPTGFEFYGMRDYVAGDDPRRIIWRATAKTLDDEGNGRYLVRESEQGITDRVSIYLDTSSEGQSPGDPSETFETLIRTGASLGVRHLDDGFTVTVHTNAGPKLRPLRGQRDRIPFLDSMATVRPDDTSLSKALDRLIVDPHRTAHTVIVTPQIEPDAFRRLRLLRDRGTSMLLVLVLWEHTEPETVHRAGSLGCSVVEVKSTSPLSLVFQRVIAGARR